MLISTVLRRGPLELDGGRPGPGEPEPLEGRDHPDALVRPLVVVVLDPHVELRLRILDRVEALPGEKLLAQGPVKAPRRRR
jgi:hypothetical protein